MNWKSLPHSAPMRATTGGGYGMLISVFQSVLEGFACAAFPRRWPGGPPLFPPPPPFPLHRLSHPVTFTVHRVPTSIPSCSAFRWSVLLHGESPSPDCLSIDRKLAWRSPPLYPSPPLLTNDDPQECSANQWLTTSSVPAELPCSVAELNDVISPNSIPPPTS